MGNYARIRLDVELKTGHRYPVTGHAFEDLLKWKPRRGEAVTVTGLNNGIYRARVESLDNSKAELIVYEECGKEVPCPEIILLQALPEKQRMELIIEKVTELGAARICAFKSEKSISLDEREAKQKRSHKWGQLALKAAKQCRRETIPEVLPYTGFLAALDFAKDADLKITLSERKGATPIKDLLSGVNAQKTALLSGPEGGFTDNELTAATKRGFIEASLGPRILRAETAPIIAVGIVMYEAWR